MSLKLLNLSSMYPGYLESFYRKHPDAGDLTYDDHYELLLHDTTEIAGSYTRHFIKLGMEAQCIISNDNILQGKWKSEKGLTTENNSDILFEQINNFKPDILWLENLTYINSDWFSQVRNKIKTIKLIVACHCAPYNKRILETLKLADFVITCTPGLKAVFENEGMKTYLVYHAFDSDLLSGINTEGHSPVKDLTFSGSLITGGGYHNSRIDLIEDLIKERINLDLHVSLERRYKIRIKQLIYLASAFLKKIKLNSITERIPLFAYGRSPARGYTQTLSRLNQSPLYGIDMYNLFASSKIVLNIHADVAGDYAGNMRMFEVTGVGSCLLTDNKKNMGDLFEPGKEVVVYDNPEDCLKKVRWLLDHDNERAEIARLGRKKTLEMHTVEQRCRVIVEILKRELSEGAGVPSKLT